MVKASSREWKNGFNLCSPFAILHGTEPVSALIGYTIAIVEPLSILPQKAWPSCFSQLIIHRKYKKTKPSLDGGSLGSYVLLYDIISDL